MTISSQGFGLPSCIKLMSTGDVVGVVWPYWYNSPSIDAKFEVTVGERGGLDNYISSRDVRGNHKQRVMLMVTARTLELVPGLIVDHHLIVDAREVPDERRILSVQYGEVVRDSRTAVLHGYVIGGRLIKHCKLEHAKELYATTVIARRLIGRQLIYE